MFRGTPVDGGAADPELAGVRHLLVGDLAGEELDVLRAASPRLAGLAGRSQPAPPRTACQSVQPGPSRSALWPTATPASCKFTPGLNCSPSTGEGASASPLRPGTGSVPCARSSARCSPAGGRPSAHLTCQPRPPARHSPTFTAAACCAKLPARPGRIDAPTGFAHPVLFDYAVAMLALGDLGQPGSLADVLDDDPNLAMTVRPSLEYRLGDAWAADPSRRDFWRLGLRLASKDSGHPLAARESARVAAMQVNDIADLATLAAAATGAATDPAGRWGCGEARLLAFLLAAAAERSRRREAMSCIDALTCALARQARAADDVDLAAGRRAAACSR